MRLDISIYGALLAAGLGAAYWASQPTDESGDEEKVQVVSLDPATISEISFSTKDPTSGVAVEAVAKRRDGSPRFWVTHVKTEPVKDVPNPHAAKDPIKDPTKGAAKDVSEVSDGPKPPKVTTEQFLANEKMDELTKSFEPFVAARIIGNVGDDQLAEFGLKGATDRLVVKTSDGKTLALLLGKKSYGSRNRFVLETEGQGRVLLVDDQGLENLERAPLRLYDRRLVSFELADVQNAVVTAGTQSKRLAHTQRDKTGELLWTEDEENAQPKPSFDSWMDKVAKLRITAYGEAADEAALAGVAPFLEIAFEKDGKVLDTIKLKKVPGEPPVYWVTSDFLGLHGKIPPARIEPIEKDLGSIVADTKS